MRTSGSLFYTSLKIALRESGKRLVLTLIPLGLCGAMVLALVLNPAKSLWNVRIALVNLDSTSMGAQLPAALLQDAIDGVAVDIFTTETVDLAAYAAVITVPYGYTNGIMYGDNLPLEVQLNRSTPLESLWVRQMTQQGLAGLAQGQLAVQAASQTAGTSMHGIAFGLLVLDLNRSLLRAFSGEDGMLQQQTLEVTGSYTLAQYALVSLGITGMMVFGFVYIPAVDNLKHFPSGRISVTAGSAVHVVMLVTGLCYLLTALLYGWDKLPVLGTLGAGVILGVYIWLVCRFCPKGEAAGMGLGFAQMILCGGLIPLPLLPEVMGKVAPWFPFYWIMQLLRPL